MPKRIPSHRFEPLAEAHAHALVEGITQAEDLIPIDRECTTIEPGGQAHASTQQYHVGHGVHASCYLDSLNDARPQHLQFQEGPPSHGTIPILSFLTATASLICLLELDAREPLQPLATLSRRTCERI